MIGKNDFERNMPHTFWKLYVALFFILIALIKKFNTMKNALKIVILTIFLSTKGYGAPDCKLMNFCGHMCLVCDAYDYVIWDSIYCPPEDGEPSTGN